MNPRRVLFIRLSAMGDILLITPVLRLFHERFPETQIDVLVKRQFAQLLQYHPLIRNLIQLPDKPGLRELFSVVRLLRSQKYDMIFDLQKHWRSYFLTARAKSKTVRRYKKYAFQRFLLVRWKINRYKGIPEYIPERYFYALRSPDIKWQKRNPEFHIPDAIRNEAARKYSFPQNGMTVAIAPGAAWRTKRWPVSHFIALIQLIRKEFHATFIILGGKSDRDVCAEITAQVGVPAVNLCGQTSLLESGAVMSRCELLVTNDTGMMHVATALGRKVIAVFGPTVKEFGFFPFSDVAEVVENRHISCRPCSYHGSDRCPKKHFRCMEEIKPEQVFQAVTRVLAN